MPFARFRNDTVIDNEGSRQAPLLVSPLNLVLADDENGHPARLCAEGTVGVRLAQAEPEGSALSSEFSIDVSASRKSCDGGGVGSHSCACGDAASAKTFGSTFLLADWWLTATDRRVRETALLLRNPEATSAPLPSVVDSKYVSLMIPRTAVSASIVNHRTGQRTVAE